MVRDDRAGQSNADERETAARGVWAGLVELRRRRVEQERVDESGSQVGQRRELVAGLADALREPRENRRLGRPRDGEHRAGEEIGEPDGDEGEPDGAQ